MEKDKRTALYGVETHHQWTYKDGIFRRELSEAATIRKFRIVQAKGSREVNHYNLQMIIAVGFNVNNDQAVQLRKWANTIVKDYTIQGSAIDDERQFGPHAGIL